MKTSSKLYIVKNNNTGLYLSIFSDFTCKDRNDSTIQYYSKDEIQKYESDKIDNAQYSFEDQTINFLTKTL
jgi:hypothetical protein